MFLFPLSSYSLCYIFPLYLGRVVSFRSCTHRPLHYFNWCWARLVRYWFGIHSRAQIQWQWYHHVSFLDFLTHTDTRAHAHAHTPTWLKITAKKTYQYVYLSRFTHSTTMSLTGFFLFWFFVFVFCTVCLSSTRSGSGTVSRWNRSIANRAVICGIGNLWSDYARMRPYTR